MRPIVIVLVASLPSLSAPRTSHAQSATDSTLTGRVTADGSRPVLGALVRFVQGPVVRETRTASDGTYRLMGIGGGSWIYSVSAIGYRRAVGRADLSGPTRVRDFALERLPAQLDTVRVDAAWAGLRISVGDARTLRPVDSARVRVIGPRSTEFTTDSTGRFELERLPNSSVSLTVERTGYARRIVHAVVPDRGAADIVIALDSAGPPINDEMQWQDMLQRLRTAGVRAVQVGGDELQNTGSRSLKEALGASPSAIAGSLPLLTRDVCLFIDGIPKPGMPADGIDVASIEFVEAYPPGSEHSRTLQMRWPPGGQCGAPIGSIEEKRDAKDKLQYIVVWLKRIKPRAP